MKKILVALSLCLVFLMTACSSGGAPTGMQTVDCDGLPYLAYLPDQWEVRRANDHLEACVSSSTPVVITVRHFAIEEENVNDYWQIEQVRLESSYAEFKVEEKLTGYTVCEQSGAVVSYSGKLGEKNYRFLQAMTVKEGVLYLVTYSAQTNVKTGTDLYTTYLDDAYRVIDNMAFAEAKNEATGAQREENEKGLLEIGDLQTEGWDVRLFAPKGWVDESYGTFAFARDPESGSSLSLCMEQTDAVGFGDYFEEKSDELKALYPKSEFSYKDASGEEGATVGDSEKLVFREFGEDERKDGMRTAQLDYVLVTDQTRYQCTKIAIVGEYKLYVLTFMFPEEALEKDMQKQIVSDVLSSLIIN